MKQNRTTIIILILLIVVGALCRPFGFAPQLAMALFGGAVIADKKWAFALPVFSMFISDALFELLTRADVLNMPGFYQGQWVNYLLIAGITFIGMAIRKINLANVLGGALIASVVYFLLSNTAVWLGGGGLGRPISASGFYMCLMDGAPFFKGTLLNTLCFSAALFGGYNLVQRSGKMQKAIV